MFKNTYQLGNIPNFFHRQIAHTSLFQMRYDSLVNSKKWPSESSKGSGISTFCQSDSVKLFCLYPNYYFSNFHCSSLEWQNFLKFDLVASKWPKFNNWSTFIKNVTDFIHLRPPQTLSIFLAFWVVVASATLILHIGRSLGHFLEDSKLLYLNV